MAHIGANRNGNGKRGDKAGPPPKSGPQKIDKVQGAGKDPAGNGSATNGGVHSNGSNGTGTDASKQLHDHTARARTGTRPGPQTNRPAHPDDYSLYLEDNLALLLDGLKSARDGDLSIRMPVHPGDDMVGQVHWAFNGLVERSDGVLREVERVTRVVGREGRVSEQASVSQLRGQWLDCMDSFNRMIDEFAWRTQEVGRIINDVSEGDLAHKMILEFEGRPLQGDHLKIGTAVNQLVDRLRLVSSEVTRVAREVGTEGKLGGQAEVKGVSGTWKDLTDNVNLLAGNLTTQVRNIALVTTAVANGDLSQKITVDARGEILELKSTVNTMVEQLRAFAAEVTRVAKEVGTEGKLGGQAEVKGVSGTWKDLTDNVNLMASNLTSQVRGIVKVVTAVANGDLSQKFSVAAKGEIAALADTINDMTDTLRIVRRAGHHGRARGRHRRKARRPGEGAGRRGHVEGPHRQREPARVEPHQPGAKHRAGHDGGRERRPLPEDHGRRRAARSSSSRTPSTRWSSSSARSRQRSRASRARSAPKESSAARPT